jgi:hypothetical protein
MLPIVIGAAALVATLWGVYYAYGQLREAKRVREENRTLAEKQAKEDDLWADKYVKAGKILCEIADWDRFKLFQAGLGKHVCQNGTLSLLFSDDIRRHILGQLIQKQDDNTYALRPIDTAQLRLRATRDLIDVVLVTIEKFQKQKPEEAKELGL